MEPRDWLELGGAVVAITGAHFTLKNQISTSRSEVSKELLEYVEKTYMPRDLMAVEFKRIEGAIAALAAGQLESRAASVEMHRENIARDESRHKQVESRYAELAGMVKSVIENLRGRPRV